MNLTPSYTPKIHPAACFYGMLGAWSKTVLDHSPVKSQTETETEEQVEPENNFLRNLLLVVAVVMVVGLTIVFATGKMSFRDVFEGVGKMNRRVLTMTLLPLLLAVIVLSSYWRKKKEERMWKDAILKARARKEAEAARREAAAASKAQENLPGQQR